jgi:hypothetical protein
MRISEFRPAVLGDRLLGRAVVEQRFWNHDRVAPCSIASASAARSSGSAINAAARLSLLGLLYHLFRQMRGQLLVVVRTPW